MRNRIYLRPTLYDLSQGSRIKFLRIFRHLTQDNVSDDLGITGENKRRTLTRYEKGDRNPSKSRLQELSNILLVNDNLIKQYEFKCVSDILYFLLWLEEMFPKMRIDLGTNDETINLFFDEWNSMRDKKQKMIIDIEHYLKIRILNTIEEISEEDGYKIVNLYLEKDFNDVERPKRVHESIRKKVTNEYYQKIFSKYDLDKDTKIENIPIWEFLEIITFGELINFFDFFTDYYNLNDHKYIFILREVNKLRNAVAHNSCVLCDLDKKDNFHRVDTLVINYLKECGIGKENRNTKLSNSRIRQITYTLYMFNIIVSSEGVKNNVKHDITKLFYGRIILNSKYYNNNGLLKSIYNYFDKIIEKNYKENLEQ